MVTRIGALGLVLLAACGGQPGVQPEAREREIQVTAEDFYFLPTTIELGRAGRYELVLANEGSTEHGLQLVGRQRVTVAAVAAGKAKRAELTLEAGSYRFYCPIRNHRHHGMEGFLRVTGS